MHVIEDGERLLDVEGTESSDIDTARAVAIRGIRSVVAESFSTGEPCSIAAVEICDEDGNLLLPVTVAEAVETPLKRLLSIVQTSAQGPSET
ncbi:hypothetical protein DMY87_23245 [Rhizobium wuzhouense]|uniref:DUF6894 domain-containing protein n=2 Tax=Rhizobium/Agrobacterium group TaxID=227290 RepID=A0ABX5NK18_9HYPH|nr:hypothetical protein DMY87_23245 [Rhizobium wuzhouense]